MMEDNSGSKNPESLHGICLVPEIELPLQNFTTEVPVSQFPHKNAASIFLIILFTSLGIAVYIFCSFVICKFHSSGTSSQPEQQVVEEDEEELGDIQTVGLQPSVISAITIRKYRRGEGLIEGTECSVCLSEFQEDETLRILPQCNHAFHMPCIDTWLRSHTNCPMCRAGIVIPHVAAVSSPQQNSGPRHEAAARVGHSENATELTLDMETEGESLEELNTMDITENSKEEVLSAFCASRRSASLESLSSVSQSTFDDNEMSAGMKSLCVDRVMQKQQMIRRSQSAVLLR